MAAIRHLNRAPIREAVVDLRVVTPDTSAIQMDKLRGAFAVDFPQCEERHSYESLVEVTQAGISHAARELGLGYICRSVDRQTAVIVSADGFSFSKLPPYTEWETVIAEARRYWNLYLTHVTVAEITRLGVRFINRFVIPRSRRIEQYLTSAPILPEGFTAADLNGSLMRLELRDERAGITARMTQVFELADIGTSVILDTDSYTTDEMPVSEEIWERFGELRIMKNRIFFGSLTESALEDFK